MTDPASRLAAALADRYAIQGTLGHGGMATVYLADDRKHDRQVAVKVLRPDLAATLGPDRFLREIKIAAQLQHPHILTLIDSGEADGFLYFVMPYVKGESLRDRLNRERELPVEEAVRILHDVADALGHAHELGVVHRDVKPDNVMLSGRHALVTDFGVAKAVSDATASQGITTAGVALGTPAYMAPEQALADPTTDHRADIYSLGAMGYEMLCGRPPFSGDTLHSLLAAHVSDRPLPVRAHRPGVPEALDALIMRCLEKKPPDRWQSAADLAAELERHELPISTPAGSRVTAARAPGAGTPPGRPLRTAGLVAAAGVGLLAVIYGLMLRLGLPDWVFNGFAAVLALGLPFIGAVTLAERRRARAGSTAPWPRWLTWRTAAVGGGTAFGLMGLVTVAYTGMRLLGIGPVGTLVASGVLAAEDRIVLADFEGRSSDSSLAETVTELLRIDLAQSPTLTLLDPVQIGAVLGRMQRSADEQLTPGLAMEIAQREGLKAVITGEVVGVGSGYVISARLQSAVDGSALYAVRESAADADQVIRAVDRLSGKLRERIGESLRTIRADAPLDQVSTSSIEALRKYAQADRANNMGEFRRAIDLLGEAVALDSGFAMAHRKLGVILTNQGWESERARQAFLRAFELRERLTDRERYLAEAAYSQYVAQDQQATIAAYRSLLDRYPTDRIALNNLALVLAALGRAREAEELYRRSIALGHAPAATYTNAIVTQFRLGLADSAAATLQRFAAEYPENPTVLQYQAAMASSRFDYATAEQHARILRERHRGDPIWDAQTSFELANLMNVRGRIADGRRYMMEGYEAQRRHGLKWIPQTATYFEATVDAVIEIWFRGRGAAGLARLDDAVRRPEFRGLSPEERDYLSLVNFYARGGRVARARQWFAEYDATVDAGTRATDVERAKQAGAGAAIALAEGRFADAIAGFRRQRQLSAGCTLCVLPELGEAYDRAGMADSAIAVYQRYLSTPELFRTSDWLNLWFVLRRLGALHEARGEHDRAAVYYSRFVDLWRDADPELQPLVEEVRERLAGLVGESPGRTQPTKVGP